MPAPLATYRLHVNNDLPLSDAAKLTPYLADLGISDVYCSPILKARPGSGHGYDVVDHSQINPEVGDESQFREWASQLSARGMGVLLDIVPNHMAVIGSHNPWWHDVLENGPSSPYSGYFDITWTAATRAELQGRILIPILGEPYAKVLESQQLKLEYEAGAFVIRYFEHTFPVAPRSYVLILGHRLQELEKSLDPADPAISEYQSILTAVKHLPLRTETNPAKVIERQREKEVVKRRLTALVQNSDAVRSSIEGTLAEFNGVPGDPASFDLLEKLLDDQVYRLAFWRVAAEEINYRRFFDVNELAALSMERTDVFESAHDLILRLVRDGCVRGLRIDHPDGLYDPREYLERLQTAAGPLYVVVEKILGAGETLPSDWPTAGTTGYEFLNLVNGLFVDSLNQAAFSRLYAEWYGDETTFAELTYQKKILILQIALAGEMQMLTHQLDRLAQRHRTSRDFTRNGLRIALREIIACFPVYRSYIGPDVSEADRRNVLRAVRRATSRNAAVSSSIFNFIRDTLLLRPPGSGVVDAEYAAEQRRFVGKFQQVTSPVMAKAAEDTAAYIFNRLVSLNEVGGEPDRFGVSVTEFHEAMRLRLKTCPDALSATATHDTKRGEDIRARIDVLSEMPDQWRAKLTLWSQLNEVHRTVLDDVSAPDHNEECFLYQTLLGAWPDDDAQRPDFTRRVQEYAIKALHEAKVHSSWINPNQPYDDAIAQFVARILDSAQSPTFLEDFIPFQRRLREFGMLNSLAQTLIKVTAPGVPDFYQGTELWDLSFVDPDNRRPVDFEARRRLLISNARLEDLIEQRADGRIKMHVTRLALAVRRRLPEVFTRGDYVPLEVFGPMRDHLVAFARVANGRSVVTLAPRLLVAATPRGQTPFHATIWDGTTVALGDLPESWRNVLAEEPVRTKHGRLDVAAVFRRMPLGLLVDAA